MPTYGQGGEACVELDCSGYQLKKASIHFGPKGPVYSLRCGPLSPADLSGLEHASRVGMQLRLVFPDAKILLAEVRYAPMADQWAFVEGRLVETPHLKD